MKTSRLFKLAGAAAVEAQQDKSFSEKVRAFFRMLTKTRTGEYKPSYKNLFMAGLSLFYIISPIDLIPEALFGPFGLIDDFGILLFGMKFVKKEIFKFIEWEMTQTVYDTFEDAKIIK